MFLLIFFFISFQLQQRALPRKNGVGSGRYRWLCSWTTKKKHGDWQYVVSIYVVFLFSMFNFTNKKRKRRREDGEEDRRKEKILKTGWGPHVRRQYIFFIFSFRRQQFCVSFLPFRVPNLRVPPGSSFLTRLLRLPFSFFFSLWGDFLMNR